MRITKDEMIKISENLYKYSVMLVEDNNEIHKEVGICQQKVKSFLNSLLSKGCVTKIFAFNHGYYRLTTEGLEYLKDKLALRNDELPVTFSTVAREIITTEDLKEVEEN